MNAADMLYLRGERWWGDFRSFRDVSGAREPLTPAGDRYATKNRAVALRLANARVEALMDERHRIDDGGHEGAWTLVEAGKDLLRSLAENGLRTAKQARPKTIQDLYNALRRGIQILGEIETGDERPTGWRSMRRRRSWRRFSRPPTVWSRPSC